MPLCAAHDDYAPEEAAGSDRHVVDAAEIGTRWRY